MRTFAYGFAGLAILAVVYLGSYLSMITPHTTVHNTLNGTTRPLYRFGGEGAELFFRPAFELDRIVRSERWALDGRKIERWYSFP
jgi:hypothetical protein